MTYLVYPLFLKPEAREDFKETNTLHRFSKILNLLNLLVKSREVFLHNFLAKYAYLRSKIKKLF